VRSSANCCDPTDFAPPAARLLALTGMSRYRAARWPWPSPEISTLLMPKITYVDSDGNARTVEADVGSTVMETAIRSNIPGIVAECGGACACATCHVYVDEAWIEKTGDKSPMEEDMLDFAFDVRPTSRLSCQIKVSPDLDGLIVTTPSSQG
jgi:2Fe-2S ferredoxin